MGRLRDSVSAPWLVASLCMVVFIWGNSMVPGSGSSEMSLSVLELVHGILQSLGLPYEWVTNFLIRKTAHFTEYACLGVCVSNALDARRTIAPASLAATALVLVLVPSIDETIQLFTPARAGMLADVVLDCCGAAFGVFLRSIWVRMRGSRR